MGNCLKRESGRNMEWADEEWGSLTAKHRRLGNRIMDEVENCTGGGCGDVEKQRLLGDNEGLSTLPSFSTAAAAAAATTTRSSRDQVKLKITKKELEELVRKDMEGLISLEQFLASLINNGNDRCGMDHHRPWRPVLQSIPEVN